MMGKYYCDDLTEQTFKLDLVFSLEVAAWCIKMKILKLYQVIQPTV